MLEMPWREFRAYFGVLALVSGLCGSWVSDLGMITTQGLGLDLIQKRGAVGDQVMSETG